MNATKPSEPINRATMELLIQVPMVKHLESHHLANVQEDHMAVVMRLVKSVVSAA